MAMKAGATITPSDRPRAPCGVASQQMRGVTRCRLRARKVEPTDLEHLDWLSRLQQSHPLVGEG